MPPTPSSVAGRLKGLGIAVIILSVLLLLALFSLVFQSTTRMEWRATPVMQALRGEASVSDGMAFGAPAMMYEADEFRDDFDAKSVLSPTPPNVTGATPEDRNRIGERVIRNGSLTLRVDDAEKRLDEARTIAVAEGGFIANANIVNREGVRTAQVTIRVPQDAFERTISRLKDLASTVFNESTNAEDVTAQFVDLEARLSAAKAEEAQYLNILTQAKSIEETLQVTARLGDVRARIESMEGQLRYLSDRTDYATISVSLTEEVRVQAPTPAWRPGETFRGALRDLVVSLQGLADALIAFGVFFLGLLLPIGLAFALITILIRKIWSRIRSKK